MVLNNIAADCELLTNLFKNLNQFIILLKNYKSDVTYNYSNIISSFSKHTALDENNTPCLKDVYKLAKEITKCSFQTTETIFNFLHLQLYSDTLNKQLKNFLNCTKEFIITCNQSSSHENNFQTKYIYAHKLHNKFEEIYNYYITLYLNVSFFKSIMVELYNEIPEQIQSNSDYAELTIQSNKETSDLITMSKDIELIASIIVNIQALLSEDTPKDYYMQKVESGSILVSIYTATPLIVAIATTINYCANIYYKHRNNHIDLKMKEFKLELLKEYKEKGIALALDGDNGQTLEQLDRVIAATDKYLNSNPSGKLNNVEYNTQTQTNLLTDRILQSMPNNESETPTNND